MASKKKFEVLLFVLVSAQKAENKHNTTGLVTQCDPFAAT